MVNQTLLRSAQKILTAFSQNKQQQITSNPIIDYSQFNASDWQTLRSDNSIQRLTLRVKDVNSAFEKKATPPTSQLAIASSGSTENTNLFIDLYYAPLNIPTIGKSLLGDEQYQWLMKTIKPGDQAIAVMANGQYSFKGNGFVRGGIFDRIQLLHNNQVISFRDSDYYRLSDVMIEGFPGFSEKAIFIIRKWYNFNPIQPWQLELLVRRQVGALTSIYTSFHSDYQLPQQYLKQSLPAPTTASTNKTMTTQMNEEPIWWSIWHDRKVDITLLISGLTVLTLILFLQDWFTQRPQLLIKIRYLFLAYTIGFIGWHAAGQLSVVNVLTFTQSIFHDFSWDVFLLDPILFILWSYVAVTLLLWGRGIYCGWLCPFGALQELINEISLRLSIKQFQLPFNLHERLWAIKYLIILCLFGISLESLSQAEQFAEIEPFKTTFILSFNREWYYVGYALLLLFVSLFFKKGYCRFICPLGAALAIPAKLRIFNWLKRRPQCGTPCQLCAKECEIQAIHPNGSINSHECHHCLDCQVTYHNKERCPPLVLRNRKKRKDITKNIPVTSV